MWAPQTVLFLAATFIVSGTPYTKDKLNHDGHTVLLGGVFPLSKNENNDCGSLRTTAAEAMEAMIFAIRSINENDTLLPNVNLTFDLRDSCSIPNKALEKSLSYVQAPASQSTDRRLAVSGIIGGGQFSTISEALANLFRLFQIPQISFGSPASVLSDRVRFDYFFRTVPSDVYLARGMADLITHFNWSYIIALHSDDTFGRTGLDILLKNVMGQQNQTQKCVAAEIAMPLQGTEEEFDAIVARMNQPWVRNSTVVYLYGYRTQSTGIMKAIEKLLKRDPHSPLRNLTWLGCDALLVEEKYYHLIRGILRLQYNVKPNKSFKQYFRSLTVEDAASKPHLSRYWETKFNCSMNRTTTGLPSCSNFNLTNYELQPDIASITDAVYAFAHAIHGMIEAHCPDGNLCSKITVNRSARVAVNGTMLRDYLLNNISFPGLSAPMVNFDSTGNDQSGYIIKNLQKKPNSPYEYVTVGEWDPNALLDFYGADIEWHTGPDLPESVCSRPCQSGYFQRIATGQSECCWTCHQCHGDNTISDGEECSTCREGYSPNEKRSECVVNQIYYLSWSSPWGIIFIIASCLGLVTTTTIAIVFMIFNKHQVVKASSRELSAILLIGLALGYLLPFFFLTKPSVATCTVRQFLLGISFAMSFSALLVKTNRIYRIFARSTENFKPTLPRFISPISQVIISLILIGIQVILTIVWLSLDNHEISYTYASRVTETTCGESPVASLIVSLGYNLLLLILSTYFAFLARKIPENFNEAKFINITLYTIIIIWLAFVSTYFATAKLGSVYQTTSLVIAIILSASTTLCCLFVPKVFLLASRVIKEKDGTSTPSTINGINGISSNGITSINGISSNGISTINGISSNGRSTTISGISSNGRSTTCTSTNEIPPSRVPS